LKTIENGLIENLGIQKENLHLAGLLVLYNNMLQSLFGSQILTLGATVGALMVMFLILFRSLILALIAIFLVSPGFKESSGRLIHFNTFYETPAPFKFDLKNTELEFSLVIENSRME